MPNWKKVIISGSDAELNSLKVTGDITGSGKISLNDGNNSVYIGELAESSNNNNTFIGYDAGGNSSNSVAIGYQAGRTASQGNNVYIGYQTGDNAEGGTYRVALGAGAGTHTRANHEISIGRSANRFGTGENSIAIGRSAAYGGGSDTKTNLIAIGQSAGSRSNGTFNTHFQLNSGRNTTGNYNITLGVNSGYTTTGDYNIVLGTNAGYTISGSNNILLGYQAGYNLTGSNQLIIANNSSSALVTGDFANNTFNISGSVSASTYYGDGSNLTGIETDPFPYTGSAIISGSFTVTGSISSTDTVTAVTGSFSHLKGNSPITVQDPVTFQSDITASQVQLGTATIITPTSQKIIIKSADGNINNNAIVSIGNLTNPNARTIAIGYVNSSSPYDRVAIGPRNVGGGHQSVVIGDNAASNNTQMGIIAIGQNANRFNTGRDSVAVGINALYNDGPLGSAYTVAIGASAGSGQNGTHNTLIGTSAGGSLSGEFNSTLGDRSGYNVTGDYNTTLGKDSGYNASGSKNVILGYQAGYNLTGSNQLIIANNSSSALVTGDFENNTFNISGSVSASTYYGDGSNLTGIETDPFPYTGSAVISGSLQVIGDITGNGRLNLNSGSSNLLIGNLAGASLTTGYENTFIGYNTGTTSTNTLQSTFIGFNTGKTGNGSVGVGYNALQAATGNYNTAVGYRTLRWTNGTNNTALGYQAAQGTSSPSSFSNTVAIGYQALTSLTTGTGNTAIGYQSQQYNTIGTQNTSVGFRSLQDLTEGDWNNAFGYDALRDVTTGNNNIGIGSAAGKLITTGQANLVIGRESGGALTTQQGNTFLGYAAGQYVEGNNNIAIGRLALLGVSNTSSFDNTIAIGYQALSGLTTGTGNTAVGHQALQDNTTGGSNTALGYLALTNATNSSRNTAVGYAAFDEIDGTNNVSYSTGLGYAVNSGGNSRVIVIGHNIIAGGENSISIGGTGGYQGVTIGNNAKNARGISIGYGAGQLMQGSNDHNIFIGNQSGYNTNGASRNTFLGQFTGLGLSGGDNNILIGYNAGRNINNGSNNIFLGYESGLNESGSNKLYIENSNSTTPLIYGEFDNDLVRINGKLYVSNSLDVTGSVSASTYYGDGSNLTGIETDPFPYTGSAVISGSLDVKGETSITGSTYIKGAIWAQGTNSIIYLGSQFSALQIKTGGIYLGGTANNGGNNGVSIGNNAGRFATGNNNALVGNEAGYRAAYSNGYVAIGKTSNSGDSAYNKDNSVGVGIGSNYNGSTNTVAIGGYTGNYSNNTPYTSSVFIGHGAGSKGGSNNVYVGYRSRGEGIANTFLGYETGLNSSGSSNVFLGYQAGYNLTGSNQLIIANNSSSALVTGDFENNTFNISGSVSASTYYGDGSNLTGIETDPFPYTGSAVISGSLDTKGGVIITGSNALAGNYALKVANSSGTDLIKAENDGTIELNNKVFVNGTDISYSTSAYALNVSESVNIRGVINFDNASHQAWIKTANSTNRSIKFPGTGGHGYFQIFNTNGNGIQILNSSQGNATLTLRTSNVDGSNALMGISQGPNLGYGGGYFIYYDSTSNQRLYTFGNPGSEGVGAEHGTSVRITASPAGTIGTRNGGNVYIKATTGNNGGADGKVYITGSTELTGSLTTTGDITSNTFETISTTLASDSATNVDTFNTSSYTGAIYDYILIDTTVGTRAGQFMIAQDSGSVTFTDNSTKHLFDSTAPEISAQINGANVEVQVTNGDGYTFKSFVKRL